MTPALTAERVARESYGRLLALLTARTRDVAMAEDALADAFAAALTAWPRVGLPENAEAWLFAAARRKLIDASRRAKTVIDGVPTLALVAEELEADISARRIPDRRLDLMFACTHPAIEPAARTPLMLQTVLGLSGERIAAAFLIAPAAMSQRLVRAKKRILEARIPFEPPPPEAWAARLKGVLQAIYAAYAEGWSDPEGVDPDRAALTDEAIWLAAVLAAQIPTEPEAIGLLALLLHLEARRSARRVEGDYVPLEQQDTTRWDVAMQGEAELLLMRAAQADRPGRFQLEAAIQSAHSARRVRGEADWSAIVALYDGLARYTTSPVVKLNRAAALSRLDGPEAGLSALNDLDVSLKSYQPYWALRADLLTRLGRSDEARAAYDEAIARERDRAVIKFLSERRRTLLI